MLLACGSTSGPDGGGEQGGAGGASEGGAGAGTTDEITGGAGGEGGSAPSLLPARTVASTYETAARLFVEAGWIFWSSVEDDNDFGNDILRVSVQGGEPETLYDGSIFTELQAVSEDSIFFDAGGHTIRRAAHDGSGYAELPAAT